MKELPICEQWHQHTDEAVRKSQGGLFFQSIEYHRQALTLAHDAFKEMSVDADLERAFPLVGESYHHLADTYTALGDYEKAFHQYACAIDFITDILDFSPSSESLRVAANRSFYEISSSWEALIRQHWSQFSVDHEEEKERQIQCIERKLSVSVPISTVKQ